MVSRTSEQTPEQGPSRQRRLALVVGRAASKRTRLGVLAREHHLHVVYAGDAASALAAVDCQLPDLVLLDLRRGLEGGHDFLVRVREDRQYLPVLVALPASDPVHKDEGLALGAVRYLRHPIREEAFAGEMARILLKLDDAEAAHESFASEIQRSTALSIPGDPSLITRVVALLGRELCFHYPDGRLRIPDVKLALYEALANAVEHGTLEIGYEGKNRALRTRQGLSDLVSARRAKEPYGTRRVHISAQYGPEGVEYRIRDEGRGFDPSLYGKAAALADPDRLHGRGLALIRHSMDLVEWSADGRELRMVRRLASP